MADQFARMPKTTEAPPQLAPEAPAPQRPYRWGVLAIAFGVQIACASSIAFLSPIAPFLFTPADKGGLGINSTEFGLLFTATNLGTMIMLIFTGHFVDKFGVRLIMLIGQVVMGLVLAIGALVNAPWQLLVVLFICGITQSVAGPTGAKAIVGWFEKRLRGIAMGVKQAGIPAASFLAGALIPVIATGLGWRPTIAIVGGFIIVVGIVSFALYREAPQLDSHTARARSWREWATSVLRRDLVLLSVGGGILQATQFVFTSFLVTYLVKSFTANGVASAVIVAGAFLSIAALGGIIGRIVLGVVSDRMLNGRRKGTLVTVNIIATVALVLLAFVGPSLPPIAMGVLVFVFGITGISFTGLQISMAAELAGFEAAGAATGFTLAFAFGAMMILPPIAGAIIDGTGGFFWFWITLAVLSAIGVVILGLVRERAKVAQLPA